MTSQFRAGLAASVLLLSFYAQAGLYADPTLYATLATGTPGQRLQSVSAGNPAATSFLIRDDEHLRIGYWNSISANGEMADLGWMDGKYLSAADCLTFDSDACLSPLNSQLDDQSDLAGYIETLNEIENDLKYLADDAYLLGRMSAAAPLFPIAIRLPGDGVISFNLSAYIEARGSLLRGELVLNDGELMTNTAGYTKEAAIAQYSIGYSHPLGQLFSGDLFLGGRLNIGYAAAMKQVVALGAEEVGYDEQQLSFGSSQGWMLGADLGMTWSRPYLTTGFTAKNINQPTLEYSQLGTGCGELEPDSTAQHNCYFAASHGDKIDLNEVHTRNRQYTVDGTLHTRGRMLSVSSRVDLNPVHSLTGNLEQYATVGLNYSNPDPWLLNPFHGFRAGYSQNMAGRELSYATIGLTVLRILDLDFSLSELASFDDLLAPRGMGINIGINEKF